MSTTAIRMPDELKERVAAAAKRAGTTPQAFILDAIAEKAGQQERHTEFDALAEERFAGIIASGKAIPWPKMRGYLEARIAGKPGRRPVARKLAR